MVTGGTGVNGLRLVGVGQINYHLKQNEPTIHDSNIMQLVHCACIFKGQVSVLQYTVAGYGRPFVSIFAKPYSLSLNVKVKCNEIGPGLILTQNKRL